ncbi:TPA: hypothetical protein ACH3X2_011337 [Trebouxia sp. C0005]
MATGESDGPRGLNMSLDQIIAENNKSKKLQTKNGTKVQHNGRGNHQSSRGRGRGGRGRSSVRGFQSFGRGGRGQQQYAQNYAEPERIVIAENQLPNLEYRQVCCAYPCTCNPTECCLWDRTRLHLSCLQYQDCYRDEYGNVIFSYKNSELVKVSRAGDVTLNTRGENGREFRGATTLRSLNDALNCLDISVRASNPKFPSDPQGYWNVVDGRALLRYRDGLTLPAKGPQHAGRGQALMAAIKHPELPQASAATAASNAAAAQAGLLPPGAFGAGGFAHPFLPFPMGAQMLNANGISQSGVFGGDYSTGYGKDTSQIRRDQARGRHMPY